MSTIHAMDKKQVIKFFGTQTNLARAVGITAASVAAWPDPLPRRIEDRVLAACFRNGLDHNLLLNPQNTEGVNKGKTITIKVSEKKFNFLEAKAKEEHTSLDSLIFLAISESHWTKED